MHSITARAFFSRIPIAARNTSLKGIMLNQSAFTETRWFSDQSGTEGEERRTDCMVKRRARRDTKRRGNTQRTPPVITTATTESFVCALLPQSIVAQWNVPPSMSIVHTATSFCPLPLYMVFANSNTLYTSRFGLPMHLYTHTHAHTRARVDCVNCVDKRCIF